MNPTLSSRGKSVLSLLATLLAFVSGGAAAETRSDDVLAPVLAHVRKHPQGDAPNSFNAAAYQGDLSRLPIGVFDSGIGGLTVLEELLRIDAFHNDTLAPGADGRPDFENERFIYFGDQANMPYGNYSAATNTPFLRELILRDALFLLGSRYTAGAGDARVRNDKPPVKAIVIACNTATAYGLEDLRRLLAELKLPHVVVGVVEAGARGLLEAPDDGAVGVFATVGTCASGAYPRAIQSVRGQAGRAPAEISQFGSPALAGVIEGDPAFPQSLETQVATDVRAMVEAHRASGAQQPLAKVVLGCTHFPLAQRDIDQALEQLRQEPAYEPFIAAKRTYVNPAEWTARELFRELAKAKLRSPSQASLGATDGFFLSVPNAAWPGVKLTVTGALEHAYKYGRRPGNLSREDTLNVPMRPDELPEVARRLVQNRLPTTWARLSR